MAKFVPRVIVFGSKEEIPNDLPQFKIVGELEINDESSWFFNGIQIKPQDLLNKNFDYILCTNRELYEVTRHIFYYNGFPHGSLTMKQFFRQHISNSTFILAENLIQLAKILERIEHEDPNFKTVLDVDSYFYLNDIFDFPDQFFITPRPFGKKIEVDMIFSETIAPIFENIYKRQFKSLDEVQLRFYDVILITAERTFDEWISILTWALKSSNRILCFIHENSSAINQLQRISIDNCKISWRQTFRGFWFEIEIRCDHSKKIWVAAHTKYEIHKLPLGYEWIQAGKKISNTDLGIQSDDTGDNVSELNLKVNESTALYWIWKNSPTDFVGFSHYRRFFAIPGEGEFMIGTWGEHIATIEELTDSLRDCDIIVGKATMLYSSLTKDFDEFTGDNAVDIGYRLFLKYFAETQPEYLETLKKIETGNLMLTNTMMFTRWKVFDAYCQWLFSFLIPATQKFDTSQYKNELEYRIMAYIAERMFLVFITHNHLRIKTIPILIGDKESFIPQNFSPLITII